MIEATKQQSEGLSARELLTEVFAELKKKFSGREVNLPEKAMAIIADDSDWHRTRTGYTCYESAVLLKIGSKEWAVAFGTACGSYPADPYNCDIAAVQILSNDQVAMAVYRALEGNDYFRRSIVVAMADGELGTNKNSPFTKKFLEIVPSYQRFIARKKEIYPEYITMDLRPVVKSGIRYKKEFVAVLADAMRIALES